MIRVLVAGDSAQSRALMKMILERDPELVVIGEASTGLEAVDRTKTLKPNVVTMDLRMPQLDGFEATRQIMTTQPTPVVIVSHADRHDVTVSLQALQVGALTAIPKPVETSDLDFETQAKAVCETVKAMAGVSVVRHHPALMNVSQPPVRSERLPPGPVEVVGIVSSTGGPSALMDLFRAMPESFPFSVLLVQHIAAGFVQGLVDWLNAGLTPPVVQAEHMDILEAGRVYVGPANVHLTVSPGRRVKLDESPPQGGFRPSGTPLFKSLASVYGASALGIVLSGMGADGVEGLTELRASGGRIIAQDEASSPIFGMPKAAIDAGIVDDVLPPAAIGAHLKRLAELT